MNRARFIAPARRELLSAVAYYSDKQPGLWAAVCRGRRGSHGPCGCIPAHGFACFETGTTTVPEGLPLHTGLPARRRGYRRLRDRTSFAAAGVLAIAGSGPMISLGGFAKLCQPRGPGFRWAYLRDDLRARQSAHGREASRRRGARGLISEPPDGGLVSARSPAAQSIRASDIRGMGAGPRPSS